MGKKTEVDRPEIVPVDTSNSSENEKAVKDEKVTLSDLIISAGKAFGDNGSDLDKSTFYKTIKTYLQEQASIVPCSASYNTLILYDDTTMVKSDADKIYNAVTKFQEDKPLLLVLFSRGGSAASAYLIGKLCREYSRGKFVVSVPRYAKSAATLICCAANEIHMGSLSELGPIDPQINDLPALGLKNSIEHIAELVKANPSSSDMFAKYLHYSLELINLGYYERVAESAVQYAEQLLNTHKENLPRDAKEIAYNLVYKYKDHGFVIDKDEAESVFGSKVIRKNSEEYELGNVVYKALDTISSIANFVRHSFYFIGSFDSDPTFMKRK